MCDSISCVATVILLILHVKSAVLAVVSKVTTTDPKEFWSALVTGGTSWLPSSWALKTILSALAGRVIVDNTAATVSVTKTIETMDFFILPSSIGVFFPPVTGG